jgi:hypothetical protein
MVPVTTKPFLKECSFHHNSAGDPCIFFINQRQNQKTYYFLRKTGSRAKRPPLCGIVQLANSDTRCFRNWSFTNKGGFYNGKSSGI